MIVVGLLFFALLFGLWQYLWHHDLTYDEGIASHLNMTDLKAFFAGIMDFNKSKTHIQGYEMSVFFTFFVMLQFWNLFNTRYFHTYRSLVTDVISVARRQRTWGDVFSKSFVLIAFCILGGQFIMKLFYLHTHLVWSSIYFTAEIAMWPIIRCCPQPHGACSAYLVTF